MAIVIDEYEVSMVKQRPINLLKLGLHRDCFLRAANEVRDLVVVLSDGLENAVEEDDSHDFALLAAGHHVTFLH